jgi:hypothetical protein
MIERQEGHAVQDMRVVERIGEDARDEDRRDPVQWIVQVILLTLVSPALLAVLMVSGVFLGVQKIATMTERRPETGDSGLTLASCTLAFGTHRPVDGP